MEAKREKRGQSVTRAARRSKLKSSGEPFRVLVVAVQGLIAQYELQGSLCTSH